MKRKFKLLLLSLGIILVVGFTSACTEDALDPVDPVLDEDVDDTSLGSMIMTSGFLNEKYIEDDKMILEIGYIQGDNEAYDGNLKLNLLTEDLFDDLETLEHYLVAYDTDYNIISIESNEIVAGLMMAGQESEDKIVNKEIESVKDLNTAELTLLDSYSVDIFGDGEEETISMYTDAAKDPEGNIMWDDGQKWTLAVEGSDKTFVLFDDYLQLASIEYFVYTVDEEFYISTVSSGTANLTMANYRYNRVDDTFEMVVESDTSGNVNMIHKSLSGF